MFRGLVSKVHYDNHTPPLPFPIFLGGSFHLIDLKTTAPAVIYYDNCRQHLLTGMSAESPKRRRVVTACRECHRRKQKVLSTLPVVAWCISQM
jgi:hypothetical protein